ncbi:MAG TPA: oxalate/formate MFS antiporter [Acetobacteraceae bacterium]|jgi:MFS transporter, OFA family, oxalate/formate antiporter|nr:oxalate/formate MFS antiporter [Acetobacteraceae bacterium]
MTDTAAILPTATMSGATRWTQLALGLVCMMSISSPQYVWTLFTKPLGAELGASPAALQVTFSLLIVLQTFFSPFQGWLVDRFGPKLLIGVGGALSGLSWVLASFATSLTGLYLTYGLIGGLGTGIVYVGVVGQMVGWFPDRRGFAAGIVAAGYGMGAILTTFPITASMAMLGYRQTLLQYGAAFAVIGLFAALGLKPAPTTAATKAEGAGVSTGTMLRSPIFWLMFVMMTLMSTSGLMVTSQMAAFAGEFGITKAVVWGLAALPLALTIDRFTNGLTRPFFGWVSDQIGRENTMFLAFALEGIAMALWLATRTDPMLFVLLSGVVFFGWGEIFSLFPSTLTDTFGTKNATRNYGCLYMAQGIGAIFGGPMASLLHEATGTWTTVFGVAITADLLTAALAIAALKPLRARYLRVG